MISIKNIVLYKINRRYINKKIMLMKKIFQNKYIFKFNNKIKTFPEIYIYFISKKTWISRQYSVGTQTSKKLKEPGFSYSTRMQLHHGLELYVEWRTSSSFFNIFYSRRQTFFFFLISSSQATVPWIYIS